MALTSITALQIFLARLQDAAVGRHAFRQVEVACTGENSFLAIHRHNTGRLSIA